MVGLLVVRVVLMVLVRAVPIPVVAVRLDSSATPRTSANACRTASMIHADPMAVAEFAMLAPLAPRAMRVGNVRRTAFPTAPTRPVEAMVAVAHVDFVPSGFRAILQDSALRRLLPANRSTAPEFCAVLTAVVDSATTARTVRSALPCRFPISPPSTSSSVALPPSKNPNNIPRCEGGAEICVPFSLQKFACIDDKDL